MTLQAAFCCLLLAVSLPAVAQVPGWPAGEQRVQVIEYRIDQVIRIQAALGYQVMVELASDERVETVAIGDSSAWQVTANKAGNLLSIKPLQTDAATNLTVVTDVRSYNFELAGASGDAGSLPFTVRFRYPAYAGFGLDPVPSGAPIGPMIADYRVTGDKSLYPSGISDDGARTYIDWPADGPLPAVYSKDEGGAETLVNGNMRGKFFVIDGVERHLIFRIDKRRARADRLQRENK